MDTKIVSYAYSLFITIARDCANIVVNTFRPFSLQEKHVSFRLGYMTQAIRRRKRGRRGQSIHGGMTRMAEENTTMVAPRSKAEDGA